MKLTVKVEDKTFDVEITDPNANPMTVKVDGTEFKVYGDSSAKPAPVAHTAKPAAPAPKPAAAGSDTVKAPIPGVIQEVLVKEGQTVKKGDVLFVLEAMKMKNNILANRDGTVATINVHKGDSVTHGQVLLSFAD
ncbi:MAG TPA: biotin/lipoyl-binding protein [Flexilinea sp.]|nr:biotin/lipoyl-binding protein [Flexilinea sp.]